MLKNMFNFVLFAVLVTLILLMLNDKYFREEDTYFKLFL